MKKIIAYLFTSLLFSIPILMAQKAWTYFETEGLVSIEAEFYTGIKGSWEEVEGRSAYPIELTGLGRVYSDKLNFTGQGVLSSLNGIIKIANGNTHVGLGIPNENATIIAKSVGNELPSIFTYEKGADMPGLKAPARRANMITGRTNFNKTGWKVYRELVKWSIGKGKNVYFVGGGDIPKLADEFTIKQLESWGYKVDFISENDANAQDAATSSLVIVSESVAAEPVYSTFRDINIPVLVSEPFILDGMGMVLVSPPWENRPMQAGNAMLTRESEPDQFLSYSIYFTNPGSYSIFFLGQAASENEPSVIEYAFNAMPQDRSTHSQSISVGKLDWKKGNRTIQVDSAGWYCLQIYRGSYIIPENSRYPGFRVDKIVIHDKELHITDNGPVITLEGGMVEIPKEHLAYPPFLPKQIWSVKDGFAIIEAEEIEHSKYWVLKSTEKGYTGKGYLNWEGPDRTRSIEGLGGNDDYTYVRQGPCNEWLILRVFVEEPGEYRVNARNFHLREDGDNDAWVTMLGFRPDLPGASLNRIERMGDSLKDGEGFSWLDWGVRKFYLNYGINNIQIGGRSIGFGFDRFAIYKADNEEIMTKALDFNTQPSSLIQE